MNLFLEASRECQARVTPPQQRRALRDTLLALYAEVGAATVQDYLARVSTEVQEMGASGLGSRRALELLREDLEALRYGLAWVRLQSSEAGREVLDPLVWSLAECGAIVEHVDAALLTLRC